MATYFFFKPSLPTTKLADLQGQNGPNTGRTDSAKALGVPQ
jgi:hypothetical protein